MGASHITFYFSLMEPPLWRKWTVETHTRHTFKIIKPNILHFVVASSLSPTSRYIILWMYRISSVVKIGSNVSPKSYKNAMNYIRKNSTVHTHTHTLAKYWTIFAQCAHAIFIYVCVVPRAHYLHVTCSSMAIVWRNICRWIIHRYNFWHHYCVLPDMKTHGKLIGSMNDFLLC